MFNNIFIYTIVLIILGAGPYPAFAQQDTSVDAQDRLPQQEGDVSPSYGSSAAVLDALDVRNMDVKDVLTIISLKTGLKINYDEDISGQVTILLKGINVLDAIRIVLDMHNLAYVELKSEQEGGQAVHVMSQARFQELYGYSFGQQKQIETVVVLHADPDPILLELKQLTSSQGNVVFDEHTNSFILMDTPTRVAEMKALIEEADVESSVPIVLTADEKGADHNDLGNADDQQVQNNEQSSQFLEEDDDALFSFFKLGERTRREKYRVTVNMLEITLNDEHQNGVDWEAIVSNYQSLPFLGFRSTAKHNPDGEIRVGTISDEDYVVLLEALDAVGVIESLGDDKFRGRLEKTYDIDIKPSDKLLVSDIREYKEMFRRDEVVRVTFQTIRDPEGIFKVSLSPEIRPNYYTRNVGGLVVDLESKHVIVIGGIFKDIPIEGTKKVPILGDLPFLGFAFRDNEKRIRKAEYVVFISLEHLE